MLAIIGRSASYPDSQWRAARDVAEQIGLPVLEIETDELNDPRYAANPTNRCYFCKTELWSRLVPVARERGFTMVADGTNADDLQRLPSRRAGRARARRAFAARRFRILESRDSRVLARARASDVAAAVVAVSLVASAVRNAGHGRPPASRRSGGGGAAVARHQRRPARASLRRARARRAECRRARARGRRPTLRARIVDAVVAAGLRARRDRPARLSLRRVELEHGQRRRSGAADSVACGSFSRSICRPTFAPRSSRRRPRFAREAPELSWVDDVAAASHAQVSRRGRAKPGSRSSTAAIAGGRRTASRAC